MTPKRGSASSPAMTGARSSCILPHCLPGRTALGKGQRVEFGIVEGRKGAQALQVRLLEAPPNVTAAVAKHARKKPDEMIPIIEDLMKLLDGISDAYRRGKHPEPKEAKQIASLLTAVAKDLEP